MYKAFIKLVEKNDTVALILFLTALYFIGWGGKILHELLW